MSLKDALAGIKEAQQEPQPQQTQPIPREVHLEAAAKLIKQGRSQTKPMVDQSISSSVNRVTGQPRQTGKRSDPAFEKVGVYVRIDTKRKALRKWEDEGGRELSDLIQTLLSQYLQN